MSELVRFSVSLEQDLFEGFDRFIEQGKLATRSEAIRQLTREKLTATTRAQEAADVAASLTLVYDHHRTRLTDRMLGVQHAHARREVSSTHVHLTRDRCMEVIVLRGPAAELSGMKGVHLAQLFVARADAATGGGAHDHGDGHTHAHD